MGIYIPNMEMPKDCGHCRFAVDGWCYAYGKPNIPALAQSEVSNFCPLIPLPAEHGRLIDADYLLRDNQELADCDFIHPKYDSTLRELIENAPTIVPAEGGDEDG